MTALSCYRIRAGRAGDGLAGLDDLVETDQPLQISDHTAAGDFEARLYVVNDAPQPVSWASFIRSGFTDARIGLASGPSALLLVRLLDTSDSATADQVFAFSFGAGGRFLLKPDSYVRGFGLRTALNLIYPAAAPLSARLRAVEAKRRGATTTRSRVQASEQADFETFDVNRLRDLLAKAAGTPHDKTLWGGRVSGGDALSISVDDPFDTIGERCRLLDDAYQSTDYQAQFGWIDHVQSVNDPLLIARLREHVLGLLVEEAITGLSLAPPEVVDWDLVVAFRYHFDRRRKRPQESVTHADLRLVDYLARLRHDGRLDDLTVERLQAARIFAVNGDGAEIHTWPVWRCLVGELPLNGSTYILDEGDFYEVRQDYLAELDTMIGDLPLAKLSLPSSSPTEWEGDYNTRAAAATPGVLLLDKKTVIVRARKTTPIEICDLLTTDRQFVHVKRHLGSNDLSHLFAQGHVSACLLQESPEFRTEAITKIAQVANGAEGFEFIDAATCTPSEFEIVYAIAERWNGRTLAQALPFFSKINLREAANDLHGRGFRVCLYQIPC